MSARTPYPPLRAGLVAARLIGGGLLLALALSLVGWAISGVAAGTALTSWENGVNVWFATGRTPTGDAVSLVGSDLAETSTCLVLLAVGVVLLRVWLGRWRESWALVAAIGGELLVFLVVTAVVNRPRPDVPHLDAAPPTSSFPSGHTAAAVAFYGALAIIVLRELRPLWLARAVAVVLLAVPVVVGLARLYRGMHHPTDVLFGLIGGGVWLAIVVTTLLPRVARHDVPVGPAVGDAVRVARPPA